MNKNILKTKKNLTIVFTIIVSLVIIVLWISFLSLKYYKELNLENRNFNDLWIKLKLWEINIDNFIKSSNNKWNNIERKDRWNKFKLRNWKPNFKLPLSFIKFKKDKIVSYDIKNNIENDFVNKLFDSDIYNKSFELDWFLVRKIKTWDEGIILFKSLRYNFSDYLSDIFIYILVTLIFSGLLYFIWNRFVNRAFIPVEENMKDMNNFIHNAGHELKTPISVIDSNIQFIKDVKKYDESMLDEMKNETKKLNSLIDSLIKLSDIWDLKWWKAKVNLKDLVNEILNKFKENISKKAIQVNVKIRKDILIEANRDYFYILLSNLIWNAVKYNMNDWKIDISYKDNQLTIKDSWVWIPTDDFNKIFDRFYKVDESRNTEGFGIWLSLVKKIVDIYSWDIEVDSEDWEGSSFVLSFR